MTPTEFQVEAYRTLAQSSSIGFTRMVMALGVNTEAGELGDHIKKEVAQGHGPNLPGILEESGDVLWYLANLLTLYGLTFEMAMDVVTAKLRARYPEGFSTEASIARGGDPFLTGDEDHDDDFRNT